MSREFGMMWLVLLGAAGCSAGVKSAGGNSDTSAFSDTADLDEDDTSAVDDGEDPVWWALDATLALSDGEIDLNGSSLSVAMLDLDVVPMCEETLALTSAEVEAAPPDLAMYAWWRVQSASFAGACGSYDGAVPGELLLGIGELQADVRAVLGPAGLDDVADSLNGAYASLDSGETIYIFGVGGTADAYAGLSSAATAAPLESGLWTLQALFPFDY